jgi:SAM-dependent methyltransferase
MKDGTKQKVDALRGVGVLQSHQEWEMRNQHLAASLCELITDFLRPNARNALDVGCEQGTLTDKYSALTGLKWRGLDPDVNKSTVSKGGARLIPGTCESLPFPDCEFDCIVFANVFEHLRPELRRDSLSELHRALVPGGILVGQLPNPYFPIESHSRLPFLGYLPRSWQRRYWKLTPTGWDFDRAHFYSVTIKSLCELAGEIGFQRELVRNFNYPPDAIPKNLRWASRLHAQLGVLPWAWQFVLRRPIDH